MPQASNWESAVGPKPASVSWADLQTIQNNAYDRDQKRGLDELFSSNIDEKGNLNERSFYMGVAQRGLNPEAAREAMKYYQDQKSADLATQEKNNQLRMFGANPEAGGRNSASIGEPTPVVESWWDNLKKKAKSEVTPGSDVVARGVNDGGYQYPSEQPSTIAAPVISTGDVVQPSAEEVDADRKYKLAQFLGMDKYNQLMQSNPGITDIIAGPAQAEQPSQVAAPANEMAVGNAYNPTGSGNNTGSFTLPEDTTQYPSTITPGVDNRTHAQMVEDSYDPSKNMMDPGNMVNGAMPEENDQLFKWEPTNVDGQYYQQYASALKQQLNAGGYPDADTYLKDTYNSTFQSNMPPAPNQMLLAQGPEGRAKYGTEVQAYQAGLVKAKGLATKAVIDAKGKLAEFANQYGTQTKENETTKLTSGERLRDPSKRNEAAAIKTNVTLIREVDKSMKEIDGRNGGNAAANAADYRMLAPQVVRIYATAVNPGQQLNEGNLREVMEVMYPELKGTKEFGDVIARAGLYISLSKNKAKAIEDQASKLIGTFDAQDPSRTQYRIKRMVEEAKAGTATQYSNYIIGGDEKLFDTGDQPTNAPVVAPKKAAAPKKTANKPLAGMSF